LRGRLVVASFGSVVIGSRRFQVALRNDACLGQTLLAPKQALRVISLRLERGEIGVGARYARALGLDRRLGGERLSLRVRQVGARLFQIGAL
jgi:hypothetical protein